MGVKGDCWLEASLSSGSKALHEWLKRPNHNNHKTHCGCETSPLKKIEQVRDNFLKIKGDNTKNAHYVLRKYQKCPQVFKNTKNAHTCVKGQTSKILLGERDLTRGGRCLTYPQNMGK